ncbi:GAF domain-containing sensor histidine kinase [Waterburya agarophytonicola K14]|uniref:histidine kinase n=1 Tax=Waterburya agarophytonicola KI4 TaxID=2874699 RepID=A0A964FFF3_9CYAN|nr:GAF domain-containing sensor histidine kinase [Waterburya agarophytonicola]MCC0177700.1 GAF domain-containing sensor histidine kinase [Waterburya agarophytonicola KI4]
MTKPKNQLFCRLDNLTSSAREQLKLETLSKLGLLVSEAVPIFEEATQKAATFSGAPICILGLVVEQELWFKSTVGLSTTGLMNQIAAQRKISLRESFSTYVVDSQQPLVIDNTLSNAVFANSILTQHCGIKAYLGVPLIASNGLCIGTLEVMDWKERNFSERDTEYLALLARWCLGEFERDRLIKTKQDVSQVELDRPQWKKVHDSLLNLDDRVSSSNQLATETMTTEAKDRSSPIKIKLLSQLTQELRTPLTSVIGMASVLHREVYGPLTIKQREYLEIIHDSGQNLISLVDEIVNLGILNEQNSEINAGTVDIEMLCQQVINSLLEGAKQKQQELNLSVEPGNRIWSLDKEKVRQALYYLMTSIIEVSEPGGEVKVHVSRRHKALNIAVGISHPWLGEGFGEANAQSKAIAKALKKYSIPPLESNGFNAGMSDIALDNHQILTSSALMMTINDEYTIDKNANKVPRDLLGLLFCCHLTELHQGQVVVQGSINSSYRYVLQFSKAQIEHES